MVEVADGGMYRAIGLDHFCTRFGIPSAGSVGEFGSRYSMEFAVAVNKLDEKEVVWVDTEFGRAPFFGGLGGRPLVEETSNGVKVNFDVFGVVGRVLCGQFEGFSPAVKEKVVQVPFVDIYERLLFDAIVKTNKGLEGKPLWPEGKRFAVCLTHDVDEVRKTYQYFTRPLRHIRRGEFVRAWRQVKSFFSDKLSRNNPYWTFEKLMDIEEKLCVKSTFFFLQEEGKAELGNPESWSVYGRRYKFSDLKIIKVLHRLSSGGWEVGLHGSFYSYEDLDKLRSDKGELEEILNQKIHGIRQHHLNLSIPKTWEYHGKIGLEYDTSLGLKDRMGFRWGTCFPFHPINPEKRKQLSLLEIPLIIMDTTLFQRKDEFWPEIENIINAVEKQGGVLTILFHHSIFDNPDYPGWTETYKKIINLCKKKNAWITTANEINRLWRSRENVDNP